MSAAQDLFFVRLPDFVRTTTFRWTSIAIALCILLFSAFVYWEAGSSMRADMDASIAEASEAIASDVPERRVIAIEDRLASDPRRTRLAGLFTADGKRIAGNLRDIPPQLAIDARIHATQVVRIDPHKPESMSVRAIGRRLPDGQVLVIARHSGELKELAAAIGRALLLGLPVAGALSLAIGGVLSLRVQRRVDELHAQVRRIIDADLRERLPTANLDHPFDKLAIIANGMLDEIEVLVTEMAGTGNEIAHDLRTPLTRVRVGLERGRANATTVADLQAVADRAIAGVDEVLTIITSLLRIREIEHYGDRRGFGDVVLAGLLREACDLYEPIAEDKQVSLRVDVDDDAIVRCDRDLLQEAIINLVDNAVKFTAPHGCVRLALVRGPSDVIIRISDTGPGIGEDEREAVLRRFYRSDKSRRTVGTGLGLSLVSAIVKLHGFRLTLSTGPGCVAEIACPLPER
jgi:signal transduction histidine kinase